MLGRLFLIEMRFTADCSVLLSGFGVDCLYHAQQGAGKFLDHRASGLVALVEVVSLELPCEQHLGELAAGKLVIDILTFGREIHIVAVECYESLAYEAVKCAPVVAGFQRVRHVGVHHLIDILRF